QARSTAMDSRSIKKSPDSDEISILVGVHGFEKLYEFHTIRKSHSRHHLLLRAIDSYDDTIITTRMSDRVFVLGAGAIGLALAVHLSNHDREVILLRTSRDDIEKSEVLISMIDADDEIITAQVEMTSLEKVETLDGLVVITAKAFANEIIAKSLGKRKLQSPIVVMQNGLGVEQPFIEAGVPEIYRCILFVTSQKRDDYLIRFRPITQSPIGVIRGDSQGVKRVVDVLHTTGFPFSVEEKIQERIWEKVILNSAYNSICPLLEVDNGIFQRSEEVTHIALEVIEECILVAAAVGINLEIEQLKQRLLAISRAADGQNISTLEDILNGRETEIKSLNFEISRIADEQVPKIPVKMTRLLGELVQLKSMISRGIRSL
ncbi:MAG: ketopantoate reductase family protein, partial [Candidatus Thorarchaeota archaeon]